MPQASSAWRGMGLRLFIAAAGALWLWVFLDPVARLGLLDNPLSLWPVFVVLAAAQAVPWRAVRALAAFAVTTWYMLQHHRPPHSGLSHAFLWLFQTDGSQLVGLAEHTTLFTDPLQTHLFLAALCLIYWLLLYAAVRPRLWVFYNALGVLVLGVIDANTDVHPNAALVAVLLVFVAVRSVSQFQTIRARLVDARRPLFRYFAPVAVIVIVVAGLSFLLPKQKAVWADPFQGLAAGTGFGPGRGGHVRQVIGYQQNDALLGGSFTLNKQPVLRVVEPYPAYLQGQVLNTYTGKGWIAGERNMQSLSFDQVFGTGAATSFSGTLPGRQVTQHVTVIGRGLHSTDLFAAYAPKQVLPSSLVGRTGLSVDENSDTVMTSPLRVGDSYSVVSREPVDPSLLLSGQTGALPNDPGQFPAAVRPDLQLPATLPTRVRQLAHQLVADNHTEYGMVQSIESYLADNYQYKTQGIPVPGRNQDYVDQFLFETREGYCDNFSSAMAVLLRADGIPTRWVTGFTSGTQAAAYHGQGNEYIITNADAHAWVQVYFPGEGWIPFDPTPNFTMNYAPGTTGSQAPGSKPASPPTTPPAQPQQHQHQHPVPLPSESSGGAGSSVQGTGWLRIVLHVLPWLAGAAVVIALVFRRRIVLGYHRRKWRGETTPAMTRAVRHLLGLLTARGLVERAQGTTLRDLQPVASRCDLPDEEYRAFLQTVEAAWYGPKEPSQEDLKKAHSVWLNWVTRLLRAWR